jgi:hypothetical protein
LAILGVPHLRDSDGAPSTERHQAQRRAQSGPLYDLGEDG